MRLLNVQVAVLSTMIFAAHAAVVTAAEPMGTAFTYQGQLKSQGAPLNGSVDLLLSLFDVESSGVALDELDIANVAVTNGLFTVELDFGAEVFTSEARWLEVAVRSPHDPTDTNPFTTLTPRQPLTATPYALQTRGLFVDNAGDVGIGTETPSYPLHAKASGARTIYGENNYTSGSGVYGEATAASGTNSGGYFKTNSTGGYGVYSEATANSGTNYGGHFKNRSSTGRGVYAYAASASGTNYGIWGQTNSPDGYAGYFTGGKNYFEGNVGIGSDPVSHIALRVEANVEAAGVYAVEATTSHTWGVAVFGDATASIGSTSGVLGKNRSESGTGVEGVASSESGTTYGIRGKTNSGDGYAGYFEGGRNYFEGNVGIGTDSPDTKLELGGANANMRLRESGGSPYIELGDDATAKGYLQWFSSTDRMLLYSSNHAYAIGIGKTDLGGIFVDTQTNNCDVGIGTEGPNYKLHVAGDAGKPGGGSWTNSSDRRLKKNIHDLDGSLERLMQLRSVTFEYKDPEAINELPGERIGMIAQEVEEVFPDWVGEGGHGYKTVTFSGFEALTVGALRELREEKDEELREVRARNADLESRVAQLEALVTKLAGSENRGE